MADSGTYDYTTIQRRQKIAEQMLAEASKPQKIEHWAQGLAQLGNIGADVFTLNRLDKQAGEANKQRVASLMTAMGGDAQAPAAAPASPPPTPAPANPSPDLGGTIAGIESGGKYDALGPVIPKTGDRAYGKYQVMGANIPEWTKAHLGKSMTPDEFLANPQAQDAVFKGQFGNYTNKYGPEGAARAWFAGEGGMNDMGRRDILGTSVADYSKNFTAGMPKVAAAMAPTVMGADGGPAKPDAEGAYGPEATMMPPEMQAPRAAIAQAMTPSGAAPASVPGLAPTAPPPPQQGYGGIPEKRKRAIAALLSAPEGSPERAVGLAVLSKSVSGEKEDVRPMTDAERTQWQVPQNMSAGIDRNSGKPIFSPPQTNIALNTTQKGQEVMATKVAEDFQNVNSAARDAVKRSAVWDEMDRASKGFTPGATADIKLQAKRYLKDLGLIQGEDVPDAEVFKMMQQQIAIHSQPKGQGAVSNVERELFAKAIPNMTLSPEGLQRAIATSRKLDDYDRKVAQIYRDSARKNQGVPNSIDVNDEIDKLGSPLSTAETRWLQASSKPATETKQGAAPAAAEVEKTVGDKTYVKRGDQWFEK